MIRFADSAALRERLICCAQPLGLFGLKIAVQCRAYTAAHSFAQFWLMETENGTPAGAISKIDGWVTVAAEQTGSLADELCAFLAVIGGDCLEGDARILETPAGGSTAPAAAGAVLKRLPQAAGARARSAATGRVESPRRLRDAYDVLRRADPAFCVPFDAWLTDVSHKTRHGFAQMFSLYCGDTPAATAGLSFIGDNAAILSAVATVPQMRGQGFAGALLRQITQWADERGAILYTQTLTEELTLFYEKYGFAAHSRWAQIAPACGLQRNDTHDSGFF